MDTLRKVYEMLEDENFHSLNFVLNWMYSLYPNNYYGDCIRLENIVKDTVRTVRVRTGENGEWENKTFKMVIKFEEVK